MSFSAHADNTKVRCISHLVLGGKRDLTPLLKALDDEFASQATRPKDLLPKWWAIAVRIENNLRQPINWNATGIPHEPNTIDETELYRSEIRNVVVKLKNELDQLNIDYSLITKKSNNLLNEFEAKLLFWIARLIEIEKLPATSTLDLHRKYEKMTTPFWSSSSQFLISGLLPDYIAVKRGSTDSTHHEFQFRINDSDATLFVDAYGQSEVRTDAHQYNDTLGKMQTKVAYFRRYDLKRQLFLLTVTPLSQEVKSNWYDILAGLNVPADASTNISVENPRRIFSTDSE